MVKLSEWYLKPIIVLSVRNDDDNIVRAFESDASDYVRKPFSLGKLLARVRNAIKHSLDLSANPLLVFDHLKIDLSLRRIFFEEKEINLSTTEYELLKLLARNPGKIITHSHILKAIWGLNAEKHGEYLRVYVNHLRQKIEKDPRNPLLIVNEPGVGYRFSD